MTVEGERFVAGMREAIRGDIAGLPDGMTDVEPRRTAVARQFPGMNTRLAAFRRSVGGLSVDMRRATPRPELVDGA